MFVLCRLRSLVRLPPADWTRPLPEALTDVLNRKLANTVLHKVGLVVGVFDILHIDKSYIFPGDGAAHTKVTFRVITFRPFTDEVMTGRIKSCTPNGVNISIGFFDDILIPPEALQNPFRFDDTEQVWIWEYPTEDGNHVDLYMDSGEEIRFRVTSDIFVDTSPVAPDPQLLAQAASCDDPTKELEEKKIPYKVIGSVNEPGLGLLSWWNS